MNRRPVSLEAAGKSSTSIEIDATVVSRLPLSIMFGVSFVYFFYLFPRPDVLCIFPKIDYIRLLYHTKKLFALEKEKVSPLAVVFYPSVH